MTSTVATTPDTETEPPRRRGRTVAVLVALLVLAGVMVGLLLRGGDDSSVDMSAAADAPPVVELHGLLHGETLSATEVANRTVRVTIEDAGDVPVAVLVDGAPVPILDGVAVLDSADLADLGEGEHALEMIIGDPSEVVPRRIAFVIDTEAPTITLPELVEATTYDGIEVTLQVEGAREVTAPGAEVVLTDDTAVVRYAATPRAVVVTASDAAGNTTTAELPVAMRYPGGRAVHVTPSAWRHGPKREPIIAMLEAGLIDAVQMDIKDELGDVSWDTDVELADLSGAEDFNRNFDMAAAIETIHSYGARVIGRLTVYRDHRLAQWAWENGRSDMVVQNTSGTPYAGRYGQYAFTNFAHPEVQQYNLDIALEAAELGFDDILYDYIRRPDGAIEKLVIPGIGERTPEEAVVEVMATAYPLLRERGVWVGASVFGIAIDRPTQMAQDIPMMAEHVDYIAPMVYPNHWNLGEYDVPVPEDAPYDIVERSLTLYRDVLEPTGTALMPWLQDFGGYGEAEVRAQIDATESVTGERSFLLWASSAEYTDAALDPIVGSSAGDAP